MQKIKGYDGDFVLEVSGGFDIDSNDDLQADRDAKQVNGKLHLILSKDRLLNNDYKINILTEIGYQLSKDLLGNKYDKKRLEEKLNDIAKHVLIEKIYPDKNQSINRDDLMWWVPAAHKNWLVKPYSLHGIVDKVYRGENIYNDAYKYVYDPSTQPLALIKSKWIKVDEDIDGGSLIGKITPENNGNSPITGYSLNGEGNTTFHVNNTGNIYLNDDATLDYESKNSYEMQLTADNSYGRSRPVTLHIILNDISDAPKVIGFSGGVIHEIPVPGTVVGKISFDPEAAPVDYIEISGRDASNFIADKDGTIRVSNNSKLTYENPSVLHIGLRVHNALGYSRMAAITMRSTYDVSDAPKAIGFSVGEINENAMPGTAVGKIDFNPQAAPIDHIDISGRNASNFIADKDGTIRLSNHSKLDYETAPVLYIYLRAHNALGYSRKVPITIKITKALSIPVIYLPYMYVREDATVGTAIGKVVVSSSGNAPIERFEIEEGKDKEYFHIDSNGTVYLQKSVDYEKVMSYKIRVKAFNQKGSSLWSSSIISIENIPDTPPALSQSQSLSIDENSPNGTEVGKIIVLSQGEADITDFVLSGEGSDNFTIDNKGIIRVANSIALDYEKYHSFTLEVLANSSIGSSNAAQLSINIGNVPDVLPRLKLNQKFSIERNATIGMPVGSVQVFNEGDSPIVSYSLDDESIFSIDDNGTLYLLNPLDDVAQLYTLKATVTSASGTSSPVILSISVANRKSTIKKTGQTISYVDFDDGFYQKGQNMLYSRDDTTEIVIDHVTRLQWQDNAEAKTVRIEWQAANDYCKALELGGYSNWRLPSRKELLSIVDLGRYRPSLDPEFLNFASKKYWTSSNYRYYLYHRWFVDFNYGSHNGANMYRDHYVRCVRTGQL